MRDIRNDIEKINELIPMPTVISEILLELNKGEVAIQKISQLILSDAALTTNILKVVNSPLYGFTNKVSEISHAMVLLGLEEVTRLLIMFHMKQRLANLTVEQRGHYEKFWKHSASVAATCRLISMEFGIPTQGKELIAGLLHDMGKVVIIQRYAREYPIIDGMVKELDFTDIEAETQVLAVPHTEIGSLLGKRWNLPNEYVEVMKYHHDVSQVSDNPVLASIVRLADLLSEEWGYGVGEQAAAFHIAEDASFKTLCGISRAMRTSGLDAVKSHLKQIIDRKDSYFHQFH